MGTLLIPSVVLGTMYNANGKVLLYTHKFLNKKKYKRNIEGDPIWPILGNGAKLQSIEQNKNP